MGAYDFTYEIPDNFNKRVVQYLQQIGNAKIATAFMRCKYEYEKIDLAYYAGLKGGDTWDKYALDFTIEGMKEHISVLQASDRIIKSALDKALKPNESGFLVGKVPLNLELARTQMQYLIIGLMAYRIRFPR